VVSWTSDLVWLSDEDDVIPPPLTEFVATLAPWWSGFPGLEEKLMVVGGVVGVAPIVWL
jgi:hypothetical protein